MNVCTGSAKLSTGVLKLVEQIATWDSDSGEWQVRTPLVQNPTIVAGHQEFWAISEGFHAWAVENGLRYSHISTPSGRGRHPVTVVGLSLS